MRRPERIRIAADDFEVVRVLICGLVERLFACTHEEQNDAAREEVGLLSVIGAFPDLRCHEAPRTWGIRRLEH